MAQPEASGKDLGVCVCVRRLLVTSRANEWSQLNKPLSRRLSLSLKGAQTRLVLRIFRNVWNWAKKGAIYMYTYKLIPS